jgi:hypothetical protein
MDKAIKKLEKKEKSLLKGTKSLLKQDKKNDRVLAKAKMKGKC